MTKHRAPRHLSAPTRRWWRTIVETQKLAEHKLRLLTMAAEALDRCDQARAIIEREGLTTATRDGGLKTHPACRVERDSRLAFARLMRALALNSAKSRPTLQGSASDEHAETMKRWP